MTQEQLNQILTDHKEWLNDNLKGKRADLVGADLRNLNLYGANLYGADLRNADLRNADLRNLNLYGANLYGADLHGADLRNADLSYANLRRADLFYADLLGADLCEAHLCEVKSNNLTFLAIYGIGSANRQTLYIPEIDVVFCGCFNGTMEEFKLQVANNAKDTHLEAYNNAIQYLEKQAKIYRKS